MSNFETWWEREGQEFLYALNTTTDDDIKLVAEFAWKYAFAASGKPIAEQEPIGTVKELFTLTAQERLDLRGSTKVYAAPVRTKDLTKQEIFKAQSTVFPDENYWENCARAVIAADREKNK